MAKRFPLMPLLRMRETAEQKAAQELARARERAARERAREVRATQSLGDHEFDQLLTETQWRSALASRASLQGLLAESKAARELAEHEADVTHAHWAVAKQQVAGVEKLRDRHEEREAVEEAKAEQNVLDELGAQAHVRRNLARSPEVPDGD